MKFALVIVLFLPVFSCKKDSKNSTIIITVKGGSYPAKGIHVFTVPATGDYITDNYGIVKIEGVKAGMYDVYAENGNYSGKSTINLNEDEVREVTVSVDYTGPIPFIPELSITLPDMSYHPAPGDTILFQAKVKNQKEGAEVAWSSNIQGDLGTSPINDSGYSNFPENHLYGGTHTITAKVAGKEGYCAIRTTEINVDGPPKVWLYPLQVKPGTIKLQWSKYSGNDFDNYTVCCRYKNDPEDTWYVTTYSSPIRDINDTIMDYTYSASYYSMDFFIEVTNTDYKMNVSNFREILHPMGTLFSDSPIQMMPHPVNEMAYLVFENKIILYDYIQKSIVAEKTINTTSKFIDVNDNGFGLEVYLPDNNSVHVLDGNTLALKRTIPFFHEVISVTSSGQGFLICSQKSDADSVLPLQVYSLSQQKFIHNGGSPYSYCYMKKIPGKNALAACTRDGYASMLDYFEFSSTGEITLNNRVTNASWGFSVDVMEMSPDGTYFALDDDGWLRKTDPYLSPFLDINGPSLINDYSFNETGTKYYCTGQYSTMVYEFDYPATTSGSYYPTLGTPVHFFYKNGNCIVIEFYYNLDAYLVEVIDVTLKK